MESVPCNSDILFLPHEEEYHQTLSNIPPNFWQIAKQTGKTNLVADSETGILQQVSNKELIEYLYGGEYDVVEQQINDYFGDRLGIFYH